MALTFPAFLNITVRQPRWLVASPLAFATWVKLCCRCAEDENGGRLGGASSWDERVWLTLANVTADGVVAAIDAGLCEWDGDTLVVMAYDKASEDKMKTLRRNGAYGSKGADYGHLGGRPRQNPLEKPPEGVLGKPPLPTSPTYPSLPTGAGGSQKPSVWEPVLWFGKFKAAWCEAKQQIAYGKGEQDSKALRNLDDILGDLPREARLAAQARAGAMFDTFLGEGGGEVVRAGHPFSWFVARFNAYVVSTSPPPARRKPDPQPPSPLPPGGQRPR